MKTLLTISMLLVIAACGQGDSSTASASGSASAAGALSDANDPTDEEEKTDTSDLTPQNAEDELQKIEKEVSTAY